MAAAAGSSLAGSCTITATVSFDGGIPPLTATTSVALVGLSKLAVYALSPELASVPVAPPASGLVQGDDLVLLQCDAGRYDQVGAVSQSRQLLKHCVSLSLSPSLSRSLSLSLCVLLPTFWLILVDCVLAVYLQRSLWTYAVLSNCTADNVCPQVDVNSRQYAVLNSSNTGVAQITAGITFNSESSCQE